MIVSLILFSLLFVGVYSHRQLVKGNRKMNPRYWAVGTVAGITLFYTSAMVVIGTFFIELYPRLGYVPSVVLLVFGLVVLYICVREVNRYL